MKKKHSIKKIIVYILIAIFSVMFIFSSYKIITYLLDNKANQDIKEKTNEHVTIIEPKEDKKDDDDEPKEETIKVDFEALKKQNPDTIAYLKVNGTNISYVVVRGQDNMHYLYYNFNNDRNVSGWIFSDYTNKFDGTDRNIVIYGHNVDDGSMFGSLQNVLTEEWRNNKDNLLITLVTEQGTSIYRVFSTYMIDVENYYINTAFNSNEEFNKFLTTVYERSNYNYGVEVNVDDQILTLSSCMERGWKRVVVHAKKN